MGDANIYGHGEAAVGPQPPVRLCYGISNII